MSAQRVVAERFYCLDALRGLAAIAVFLGHLGGFLPPLFSGLFGVDLFYVISGFVIAHGYEMRFRSGMTSFDFIVARAIRLYPMYILGTLLGFSAFAAERLGLLSIAGGHPNLESIALAVFMLPDFRENVLFPFNAVAWSLFFEAVLNLVYCLTWKWWSTGRLFVWTVILLIAMAIVRCTFDTFDVGWSSNNAIGGLVRALYGFPLGVLLYRLWVDELIRFDLPAALALLIGLCCLIAMPALSKPLSIIVDMMSVAALVPISVVAAANTRVSNVFRNVSKLLGDISYPMYALHMPVMIWIVKADLIQFSRPTLTGGVIVAIVSLMSIFVHFAIDVPFRTWALRTFCGVRS